MNLLAELGAIQVDLGRYQDAVETLERALALFHQRQSLPTPRRADATLALGRARLALGQIDEAFELLEAANAFWIGFDAAPRWSGEAALWLGLAYRRSGRASEARQALARARSRLRHSPIVNDEKLPLVASEH
jgi:tetratricopeptide (TPR) repeat protein